MKSSRHLKQLMPIFDWASGCFYSSLSPFKSISANEWENRLSPSTYILNRTYIYILYCCLGVHFVTVFYESMSGMYVKSKILPSNEISEKRSFQKANSCVQIHLWLKQVINNKWSIDQRSFKTFVITIVIKMLTYFL